MLLRSTLAASATLVVVPSAFAAPPGGPVENRLGATLSVPARIAPGAVVTVTGTGFQSGEIVSLKLDDGRLARPDGGDVLATATALADGTLTGSFDLDDVAAPPTDGKHDVRALSTPGAGARSVHADFIVTSKPAGPGTTALGAASIAPGADQPGPYGGSFDGIPQLVAGSELPYRVTDYVPGQVATFRIDDAPAPFPLQTPVPADGTLVGTLPAAVATDGRLGSSWLRVLGAAPNPRSRIAPYAVVPGDGRSVAVDTPLLPPGDAVRFSGQGLVRPVFYRLMSRGQTVQVRLDGGPAQTFDADVTGALAGAIRLPADVAAGTHRLQFWVGFKAENDAPQLVTTKAFTVDPAAPPVDPVPQAAPLATTPAPAPTTPAVVPAPPAAPRVVPPSIASTRLTLRSGRVAVVIRGAGKGRLTLTTVKAFRTAKGKKPKPVTLASASYDVAAGRSRTFTLELTTAGTRLLKARRSLGVVVRITRTGGAAVTKSLTLKAAR